MQGLNGCLVRSWCLRREDHDMETRYLQDEGGLSCCKQLSLKTIDDSNGQRALLSSYYHKLLGENEIYRIAAFTLL